MLQRLLYTLPHGLKFVRTSKGHRLQSLSTTSARRGGDFEYEDPKSEDDVVNISYVLRDGTERYFLIK